MYRKMSSPSRPASVAQTTFSTSGALRTLARASKCPRVFSSAFSGHSPGSMGSRSRRHGFQDGSISCGSQRPTRWPMAQLTT